MAPTVQALEKLHDLKSFDCGVSQLNHWLQTTAMQHQRNGASRTFVITDEAHPEKVAAYVTIALRGLSPTAALPKEMQKKLPSQMPGFTLARLAVALDHQGKRLGEYLLLEAMERAWRAARNVGGFGLFVDAKDGAAAFYEKYGFRPLPLDPNILVLPIASMPTFPEQDPK
ncbi:GNAT family N-acetyltransferase [Pseudoduganella aquatica]|uniref:GNAT family N-acetyltransferase n=1 Tax=Pseudoduganella aquatica TaxID=2660641 RepID=UPI001E49573B|nr:GNAT family N-acetyltransferase [Pseudoduganella aquatica]